MPIEPFPPLLAVVFDFDGLILETETPDYQSWRELYLEHGRDLPLSVWTQVIGRHNNFFDPLAALEEQVGRPLDRVALLERKRLRHAQLMSEQEILPGVRERVAEARDRGLRLGVASSSSHAWVDGHLQRLDLHAHFHCIRCRDDVARAKPEPDLYLAALECLGVSGESALAVEDSPNGIRAARAAGMRCLSVPNDLTRDLDLGQADLVLSSLAELSLAQVWARIQGPDLG